MPGCVGKDELESAAWLGAIKAVDMYKPIKGASLSTFAYKRIRGSVQDYLRSVDYLSRDHRAAVRAGLEVAPENITLGRVKYGDMPGLQLEDKGARLEERVIANVTLAKLFKRAMLPERNLGILMASFIGGEKRRDIAAREGVHETRVRQLNAWTLAKLRAEA